MIRLIDARNIFNQDKINSTIFATIAIMVALVFTSEVKASHLAGGTIRYDYVGPTPGSTSLWRYKITVSMARDCRGISLTCGSTPHVFYATCTTSGSTIGPVSLTPVPYVPKPGERSNPRGAKDVSDLCSSVQSRCQGNNQALSGYELYFHEATIDLPRCNSWRITYQTCTNARNAVTNFTGGYNVALETFINTGWSPRAKPSGAPANSAPKFANDKPFPSACVGQDVNYSIGAHDDEGDSLVYETTCPWATGSSTGTPNLVPMTPRNGATCAVPIPGLTMDSQTGLISFKATTQGAWIVAFYVSEYEKCSGILKGKTYREIQFRVESCPNANNKPAIASRLGITSSDGFINSNGALEICEGKILSWNDTLSDPDVNDVLQLSSNVTSVLPGATLNEIRNSQNNTVIARYSWKAVYSGNPNKNFFLAYTDDNCPVPGTSYHMYNILVKKGASAGEDISLCAGDTATLLPTGGNVYSWNSISGDAIQPGINWFPVNANNTEVRFVPSQTTLLEVTIPSITNICGANSMGCSRKDTIEVKVGTPFTLSAPSDTTICFDTDVELGLYVSNPNLTYSYSWSPASFFQSPMDSISNLNGLQDKQRLSYKVEASSGCTREGTFEVSVSNPFPNNMRITVSDSIICQSDTLNFDVNLGSISYSSCGVKPQKCVGYNKDFVLGSGGIRNTVTSQNTPSVYEHRFSKKKTQFLYRANYLRALGMTSGAIKSIGFEIAQLNNAGAPIDGFTIKMGCTQDSVIGTSLIAGNTTVFNPKPIFTAAGINTHVLDSEFVWDGSSNLVVEICYDNGTNRQNSNDIMLFDRMLYASAAHNFSNTQPLCSSVAIAGTSMFLLPKTTFTQCSGVDSSNFNFSWSTLPNSSPSIILGSTVNKKLKSVSTPLTAFRYVVHITDTAGLCFRELHQDVKVTTKYNTKPDSVGLTCVTNGIVFLKAPTPYNITSPGGRWSGAGIINDSLGWFDPTIAGPGNRTIYYEITGNNCASKDSSTIEIVDKPNASISRIDAACNSFSSIAEHELKGAVNTGKFYGFGVDSVVNGTNVNYFLDGTKFSPTVTIPDTAYVRHIVEYGCINDTLIKIPVVASWDSTYQGVFINGVVYNTTQFCVNGRSDTLSVAGANGVWRIIGQPSNNGAITDSILGIFNPAAVNNGNGGPVQIEVENKDFCGTKGTYRLDVIRAPEARILAEDFCFSDPGDCASSQVPAAKRKNIIRVRVAKFPNKLIVDSDPNTYVDVITADISQTGWQDLVESDLHTKWDGNPWMIFPYKAEFPFCSLVKGKYPLSYQIALKYRLQAQAPDSICYFRTDTSIQVSDKIQSLVIADGDLCANSTVDINAFPKGSKYTYLWNDGSTSGTITRSQQGTFVVTVSDPYCASVDSISVLHCTSLEELNTSFEANVYPNPARDKVFVSSSNTFSKITLNVTNTAGQLISQNEFNTVQGKLEVQIDVRELPKGVYIFELLSGQESNTYRVVIE